MALETFFVNPQNNKKNFFYPDKINMSRSSKELLSPRARSQLESLRPSQSMRDAEDSLKDVVQGKSASSLLLWFVIITLIAWAILYFWNPQMVRKTVNGVPTQDADVGKSLLGAVLIGLVIVLIIWLVRACK
jgi:hypothetical protein